MHNCNRTGCKHNNKESKCDLITIDEIHGYLRNGELFVINCSRFSPRKTWLSEIAGGRIGE